MHFIWSKLGWKGDYSCVRPLMCFANQWPYHRISHSGTVPKNGYSLVWFILIIWNVSSCVDYFIRRMIVKYIQCMQMNKVELKLQLNR